MNTDESTCKVYSNFLRGLFTNLLLSQTESHLKMNSQNSVMSE